MSTDLQAEELRLRREALERQIAADKAHAAQAETYAADVTHMQRHRDTAEKHWMSIRAQVATHALPGLIVSIQPESAKELQFCVELAVQAADALIAEIEKGGDR